MKKFRIIFSILIILSTFTVNIIQASPTDTPRTIYISSVEDLHKLSRDCSYDRYSHNLTVMLNGDIDLNNEPFIPIPIFAGIFDGKGYTIKGLSIEVEGSNQGFFRYLEEGATVKNLKVEGTIMPLGEQGSIGGLIGHNQGIVENCEFNGYVNGKEIVGGLVGWNGNTAIILSSSAQGMVYGRRKVGGIAGYNAGTILHSTNNLSVNTTVEDEFEFPELDLNELGIDKLTSLSPDITDIGGIAGVNTGIIKNSRNHGDIGYSQVGYNVGGIAGRQTGYITSCENYGTVKGRKEVSGIVGQMEPHIDIIIPPSKLKDLHRELNVLHGAMNNMISHTRHTSSEMGRQLSKIQENIDAGKSHANKLILMTEDLIDKVDVTGVDILDRIKPIAEKIESVMNALGSSISSLEISMKHIREVFEELSEYDLDREELSKWMDETIKRLKSIQEKIEDSSSSVRQALEMLLNGQVEGVSELLNSALKNLDLAIGELLDETDLKRLEEVIAELLSLIDDDAEDDIGNILQEILEQIKAQGNTLNQLREIYRDIENLFNYLIELPSLDFETIDDNYQKVREGLFDAIGDMSTSLSDFMEILSIQGKVMIDDMETISDQLFLVMDLTFSLIGDLLDSQVSIDNIYRDVSREQIDKTTEGKVSHCKNFGLIEGDINVGGIAGAMAIEFKSDPEDDLNFMKNISANAIFQTSAIIQKCENSGPIIGKKNNVGGIVGSMDLGYILDAVATDLVESTDGGYVGGIAGRSYGPIVSSYAKSTLNGENNIGGITGYGREIMDCYTLVKIERFKACVGAIAGDIDIDGIVEGNYFISDTLSGIDGISYMDRAEPIDYEKLILEVDLPQIFKEFKFTFMAEDEVISTRSYNYGDPISKVVVPEIPKKEGYHGEWDEFGDTHITFDTLIKANYIPNLTVLETQEKRDDKLPIVLVEGEFTHEDFLTLTYDDAKDLPNLERETLLEQLTISVSSHEDRDYIVRYLPPRDGGKLRIYTVVDETWNRVESHMDGEYLVFKASGSNITFAVYCVENFYKKYMPLMGIGLLIITIVAVSLGIRGHISKSKISAK